MQYQLVGAFNIGIGAAHRNLNGTAFAEATKSDLKALAYCIRSARAVISAEMLAKIACPVLVAVGTEDVIGGSASELAALIPGAQALDLAGRDHMRAVGDRQYKNGVLAFLKARA